MEQWINRIPSKPYNILKKVNRVRCRILLLMSPSRGSWTSLFENHIKSILDQQHPKTILEIGVLPRV